MPGQVLDRIPGGYEALAAAVALRRRAAVEWRASSTAQWLAAVPAPEGLAATPRDLRPADAEAGRRILAGGFLLAGESLASGLRGDPWDRPSPSRRFAEALHGFGWLKDLTALDDPGRWEGLRLTLAWRRLFGRWSGFSWSADVLERRVFNLACQVRAICDPASEAEAEQVAADLARQARVLLSVDAGPERAAERAVAAAVAGTALSGPAGERLQARALARLGRLLPQAVLPDGSHASRSPQAALELFFDLSTLDGALTQLGIGSPVEIARALEGLAAAVRFFTLADGRLAAFQGGEALDPAYVAAARAQDYAADRARPLSLGGYQRLESRTLQVIADGAAPAPGALAASACAQPLALELVAGGRRLVEGSGFSRAAQAPNALRLAEGASTAALAEAPCGAPLSGFAARVLGPRLRDAPDVRQVRRHEAAGALWVELEHDGWLRSQGFLHERRLYLDAQAEELRGEDRLVSVVKRKDAEGRRLVPFCVRFHLAPQVSALVARDGKSVLIKADGQETGWWLRSDAREVALEPSVSYAGGQARHTQQVVLRAEARLEGGARIRWKLTAAHGPSEPARVDAAAATA